MSNKNFFIHRVQPGAVIDLAKVDPDATPAFSEGKDEALDHLKDLTKRLEGLQEILYAEHKHPILMVLQGMDTAGKDGTIRHVFEGVNPQGVCVVSFKVPTALETDHDFLWRVHQTTPAKGEIVIFNRSHYEDVLAVRVHDLVPEKVWRKRYGHINEFERMLVDEGTTVLKFFLHIDRAEQKQRIEERENDRNKQWKFSPADLKERRLWPEYMKAYAEMLCRTSTPHAPWYLVPANKKWYRNLVVASVLVETVERLRMRYPHLR